MLPNTVLRTQALLTTKERFQLWRKCMRLVVSGLHKAMHGRFLTGSEESELEDMADCRAHDALLLKGWAYAQQESAINAESQQQGPRACHAHAKIDCMWYHDGSFTCCAAWQRLACTPQDILCQLAWANSYKSAGSWMSSGGCIDHAWPAGGPDSLASRSC